MEKLSLKWNNHKSSLVQLVSMLREKSTYTDVTLACDGQLYNVHKIVLAACSDYFSTIFENIKCSNPVIVLKDLSTTNLETLLDYMYIGEVSIEQIDLSSLLQAAESLKLKGLIVPDTYVRCDNKFKRSASSSPRPSKKSRKSTAKVNPKGERYVPVEDNNPDALPVDEYIPTKALMKIENKIIIKEEVINEEYSEDFPPHSAINPIQQISEDSNQRCGFLSPFPLEDSFNTEISNYEKGSKSDTQSLASSSNAFKKNTKILGKLGNLPLCFYCNRSFTKPSDLIRHIRTHTGERPYACCDCSYRSNRKSTLVKHMRIKHNEVMS